jgi:endonuclease G
MSRRAAFLGGAVAGMLGTYLLFRVQRPFVDTQAAAPINVMPSQMSNGLLDMFKEYGFPGPVSDTRYRIAYTTSFNRQLRNPNWVAEHLTKEKLNQKNGDRSKSQFTEDESIPALFRARLADYFRSGFDRGHMAPAADAKISQEAMDETHLLTNIAPQVGEGFNRHYWAYLEAFCRDLTKRFADVYVITGPLYLPNQEADGKWYVKYQVIGNPPNVAVPTHFFKVILTRNADGKPAALGAFVLPNAPIPDNTPLERFSVPVKFVERAAGLEFFQRLDRSSCPPLCKVTTCDAKRVFDAEMKQRGKR